MPVANYGGYLQSYARGNSLAWHIIVPAWFKENPPPLKDKDAGELARLKYDDLCTLMADQMTWLHRWSSIRTRITNRELEGTCRYTWDSEAQEMVAEEVDIDVDIEISPWN